jgi:hypothetical protein
VASFHTDVHEVRVRQPAKATRHMHFIEGDKEFESGFEYTDLAIFGGLNRNLTNAVFSNTISNLRVDNFETSNVTSAPNAGSKQAVPMSSGGLGDWNFYSTYFQSSVNAFGGPSGVIANLSSRQPSLTRSLLLMLHASKYTQLTSNPVAFLTGEWERAIQELHDAIHGPIEGGCEPPAKEAIASIERFVPIMQIFARFPEFEVNDDGSVTLRWKASEEPRSFVLRFGRRILSAVLSEPKSGPGFAQSLSLNSAPSTTEAEIMKLLLRQDLASLIK